MAGLKVLHCITDHAYMANPVGPLIAAAALRPSSGSDARGPAEVAAKDASSDMRVSARPIEQLPPGSGVSPDTAMVGCDRQ